MIGLIVTHTGQNNFKAEGINGVPTGWYDMNLKIGEQAWFRFGNVIADQYGEGSLPFYLDPTLPMKVRVQLVNTHTPHIKSNTVTVTPSKPDDIEGNATRTEPEEPITPSNGEEPAITPGRTMIVRIFPNADVLHHHLGVLRNLVFSREMHKRLHPLI